MNRSESLTEPPAKWLKLRKRTVVLFGIESLLIGMDSSLTFLTLWIYIKRLIKPENPELCYGLISAAYLAATLALSGFVARIADKTRNARRIFFFMNTVTIIGNLLYAIPISAWTLGIARFLTGFCGPLRSVITGEVARSHHPDSLVNVLSVMSMAFTFGYTVGPALNAACKDVHFHVYKWQITFANFPGIYMAVFFLFAQVLCFFLLSDLSKIYDLRDELSKGRLRSSSSSGEPYSAFHATVSNDRTGILQSTTKTQTYYGTSDTESEIDDVFNPDDDINDHDHGPEEEQHFRESNVMSVLKSLFTELNSALLLCLSFIDGYFETTFELWVPMVVIDTLRWSATSLALIALWGGIGCVAPCILLAVVNLSDHTMYIIALFSIGSTGIMEGIFMVLKEYTINNIIVDVLWGVYGLMFATLIVTGDIFLVSCLAKMVDSSIQTFVDSVRLTAYRYGSLTGLLTAPLIFRWIHIAGWVHLTVLLVIFVLMLARRKFFINPEIVIFGK